MKAEEKAVGGVASTRLVRLSDLEKRIAADNEWAAETRTKTELRENIKSQWHDMPIEVWIEAPDGTRFPAKSFSETVPVGPYLISAIPRFRSIPGELKGEVSGGRGTAESEMKELAPLGIIGSLKNFMRHLLNAKKQSDVVTIHGPRRSVRSALLGLFPKWCDVDGHIDFLPNVERTHGARKEGL